MGRGQIHLVEKGALDRLRRVDPDVRLCVIEADDAFPTEIGTAFGLHRKQASQIAAATRSGDLACILAGNCNSAVGTISGLQLSDPGRPLGVVWFDGHGDCNTPDTFTGTFLDAMGISTITGRCWQALSGTIPGFRPVPDAAVVLVGAHGADNGAMGVLKASGIAHVPTARVAAKGVTTALGPELDAMARRGVDRVYVHLDLDVLDADWAPANGFAPRGGLLPQQLHSCVEEVTRRFTVAAAAVASYDPDCDCTDTVLAVALDVLGTVALSRNNGGLKPTTGQGMDAGPGAPAVAL